IVKKHISLRRNTSLVPVPESIVLQTAPRRQILPVQKLHDRCGLRPADFSSLPDACLELHPYVRNVWGFQHPEVERDECLRLSLMRFRLEHPAYEYDEYP